MDQVIDRLSGGVKRVCGKVDGVFDSSSLFSRLARYLQNRNREKTSKSVRRTSMRMKSFPGVLVEKRARVSSREMKAGEVGLGKAACQGCCSEAIIFDW